MNDKQSHTAEQEADTDLASPIVNTCQIKALALPRSPKEVEYLKIGKVQIAVWGILIAFACFCYVDVYEREKSMNQVYQLAQDLTNSDTANREELGVAIIRKLLLHKINTETNKALSLCLMSGALACLGLYMVRLYSRFVAKFVFSLLGFSMIISLNHAIRLRADLLLVLKDDFYGRVMEMPRNGLSEPAPFVVFGVSSLIILAFFVKLYFRIRKTKAASAIISSITEGDSILRVSYLDDQGQAQDALLKNPAAFELNIATQFIFIIGQMT